MKRYCEYTVCTGLRLGNKIYLSQRLATENFVGHWQWPGGEVENKENPIDAAKREVKEETGLDLNIDRLRYLDQITGDPTTKCCFVYFVELNEAEIPMRAENKSSDWVLMSYEDALKLHLMPGLAESIHKLKREK